MTYYTPAEVQARLGLSKVEGVLAWIRAGELGAVNVARRVGQRPRWRISEIDLAEFLERRAAKPAPKVERRPRAAAAASKAPRYF